ncbi:hypothetical protein VP91_00002000 [Candidatus Pelagibacter ubique]|uniref:Alpha-1,2-fucosyltransferase n=1 Tax=Pelagibacter ubique TaxID=198252 RepID=A0ABX1T0C8_PELUQ|nr:hypothetical protein [Candidatus Pelagibacter ubique]NMN67067.1 hypothetical protein [Candidatus Pelagibacter ubique]
MLKNFLKKILTNLGPQTYLKKYKKIKMPILNNIKLDSLGNKNKHKKFYIIRRSPGAGFFSNLTYVLGHLEIAEKYRFTPVVDMKNFPTIYNEKKSINNSTNSWEYYFKKVSKYDLKEVYKSKNLIFTSNFFESHMATDMASKKNFYKLLKKYIHIKLNIKREIDILKKKIMTNDKVLGVHFRGTTYKTARGHAFPIPLDLMIKNLDFLIKKFKYDKIFIVTEEEKYLDYLKKYYKKKLIFLNVFRTNKLDAFKHYPRSKHRYKLGKEILIETILLSYCSGLTFVKSNVSSAAILFSRKKIKLHPLFIGYNSRNKYISKWYWYFKKILPEWMGGFRLKFK